MLLNPFECATVAGATNATAALLATPDNAVRVRALLCLGMLLPSCDTAQRLQFIQQPAAVAHLMAMLRQKEDKDCQIIARDVLGLLSKSPELKSQLENSVRQHTSYTSQSTT
eukprot:jgi/Chrzof1/14768/Cz09g15140.t1